MTRRTRLHEVPLTPPSASLRSSKQVLVQSTEAKDLVPFTGTLVEQILAQCTDAELEKSLAQSPEAKVEEKPPVHRSEAREGPCPVHRSEVREGPCPVHRSEVREGPCPVHRRAVTEEPCPVHRSAVTEEPCPVHRSAVTEEPCPVHRSAVTEEPWPVHSQHRSSSRALSSPRRSSRLTRSPISSGMALASSRALPRWMYLRTVLLDSQRPRTMTSSSLRSPLQ